MKVNISVKLITVLMILISCQNKINQKQALENEINIKIAEDIRSSISKMIDGAGIISTGLPIPFSSLINSIITKEKQDSLIIHPIRPYLKLKLDQLNIKELEKINADKKERYKIVYETIVANRNEIIQDISKNIPFAKILINGIINNHK
jgi:hypothetical protein